MSSNHYQAQAQRWKWIYLFISAACVIVGAITQHPVFAVIAIFSAYGATFYAAEEQRQKNTKDEMRRYQERLAQRRKV